jgi:copper chaperone CopZ
MIKHTFLAIILNLALVACGNSEKAATVSQVEIKVPTIQCGSCKANVEEALQALDGIRSATVDLEKKIAQASFDPAKTNLAAMEKAIAMAGYDANDTKRDPQAYADLDACCKLPEDRASK